MFVAFVCFFIIICFVLFVCLLQAAHILFLNQQQTTARVRTAKALLFSTNLTVDLILAAGTSTFLVSTCHSVQDRFESALLLFGGGVG